MKNNYERYLDTYAGKHLDHRLDKFGTWKVLGEDPNCDFGGPHHEPYLATIEGRLGDVIRRAVDMNRFWTWGAGGRFVLIKVETVTTLDKKAKNKKARIAKLKATIEKAEAELKALEA